MKECTINTKAGCYTGAVEASGVLSFKGIPFAQPPLGQLRWLPPRPVATYDAERQVDIYPPAPIQLDYPRALADQMKEPIHIPVSEDCLYLNVWTADLTTPKKGILFWVFGGSYAIGHASRIQSRGEQFVAAHPDIVVVAPNYRLGVFGSIDLSVLEGGEEYRASNNLNLLDHRAALQWVRDNAAEFAADPETITLYGHSAGSNAISHHLASPDSNRLFRRAICQSSFLEGPPPRSLKESRATSKQIFAYLGISTVEEALEMSADRLLEAQHHVFGEIYGSPVIDDVVLREDELGALLSGVAAGKEVMIGYSNGERDSAFRGLSDAESIAKVRDFSHRAFKESEDVVDRFISLHDDGSIQEACMTLQAELAMTIPAEIQARALSRHSSVFQYRFSWSDPGTDIRAPHGAPCPFVFGNQVPCCAPEQLGKQVQEAWVNFIVKGDPNNALIPAWECYRPDGGAVMDIDEEWKLIEDFWQQDFDLLSPLFEGASRLGEERPDGD